MGFGVWGLGIMALKTYRDLEIWQTGIDLVEQIYDLTREFASEEKFGLTSQMRRAAVSVPSNIAEGYGRTHRAEYIQHLSIAKGSLVEIETQLIIAVRLRFVTKEQANPLWETMQQIGRMHTKLVASLKTQTPNPKPGDPDARCK